MIWAPFLHLYQPADQQPDILEAIVSQCYRPIIKKLVKHKKARITLNINGALLELFDQSEYRGLIDDLKKLLGRGQIGLTGSAKYHAFLPFLSTEEAARQIMLNTETLHYFFGEEYQKSGFFPPEMGWKDSLAEVIEELGFKWVILDEIAFNGKVDCVDYSRIYKISGRNLNVFFRERRASNMIMSAMAHSAKVVEETLRPIMKSDRYLLTAMDGETFGHHHAGLEKMLFEVFASKKFELMRISDLMKTFKEELTVLPIDSTWASSPQDIEESIQFLSWSDPANQIHKWQWEFVDLALSLVRSYPKDSPEYKELRPKMDRALASDHFWWASAKPWWSLEMIELGAYRLLNIVKLAPHRNDDILKKAKELYEKIVSTAFEWQRSGLIRKMAKGRSIANKIPFKDRTWGLGGMGGAVYKGFLALLKEQEKEAAFEGEYERAILWRDAIWRMENRTDIYEAINAIDLLHVEAGDKKIAKVIEKYKNEFQRLRGGQPEDRF